MNSPPWLRAAGDDVVKANDCLIAFLAERLGVPKARVVLEAGSTSRQKRVRIVGVETKAAVAALAQ